MPFNIKKSLSHLTQSLFSFNYFVFTRTVNVRKLCFSFYIDAIIYYFQFKIPIKLMVSLLEHVKKTTNIYILNGYWL